MTSLFDIAPEPGMPLAMVSEFLGRGTRGVSLLEFFAIDEQPEPEPVAAAEAAPAGDGFVADERALQIAVMIDAAREEAAAEARAESDQRAAAALGEERARIDRLAAEFARDRQRYFASAEVQVVRLALAVAQRVLAREVAASGLPLESVVRAALSKVQDGSSTVLRVRPEEAEAWTEALRGEARVEVQGDARLAAGDCVLDTRVGQVELGLAAQMHEIERGFNELLDR